MMEGVHKGGRTLKDVVVGSKAEAARRRQQAQQGAAAAGRVGQAVKRARENSTPSTTSKEDKEIAAEVARSMKKSNGLVQAAVEHLETAERSWDKFVTESGIVIDGHPSEEQVLTYMSKMSRQRQRMCLAQRGTRRKGVQKNSVRNYVAEMANNLWDWKYPSFGKLDSASKKEFWGKVFGGYQTMYAAASAPTTTQAAEERAEQLVAQTEQVCRRKHVYRTEMFQLQDLFIGEKEKVNEALIAHAAVSIMQSTAARVGMLTKTRHDATCVRWKKDNPLRVRDIVHKVRKLHLTRATGENAGEATSQMQLNWRRVKKEYFSVYLFRSAVTANAVSAVRRTTVILRAMQMRFGRYRACCAGLTAAELERHKARLASHGYVRLRDTVYSSWKEMFDACEKDAFRYNAEMMDDPALPEVANEHVDSKTALQASHVYKMLERAGLKLGYAPNEFGLWSIRRYSISMIVKKFGIYLATRQAQHSKATNNTVQSTYDADNASNDFGAAEMPRDAEDVEPGDSLAECRVPAIFDIQKPSDVPKDSAAWREMVLENEEYVELTAEIGKLEAQRNEAGRESRECAKGARQKQKGPSLAKVRAKLSKAKDAMDKLMSKLGHRAVVVHRQHMHEEGNRKLERADEATLLKQTHYEEYEQMSEGDAVAFLLERCNAVDERDAARSRSRMQPGSQMSQPAQMVQAPHVAAATSAEAESTREARRQAWRQRREAMLGVAAPMDIVAHNEVEEIARRVAAAVVASALEAAATHEAAAAEAQDEASGVMAIEASMADAVDEADEVARRFAANLIASALDAATAQTGDEASVMMDSEAPVVEDPVGMVASDGMDNVALERDVTTAFQPPMTDCAAVDRAMTGATLVAGSRLSKRDRDDEIYMEYKRLKGTGVNVINVLMEKHKYRPTQKSTFTGMIKRARERAGDVNDEPHAKLRRV